MRRRLVLLPLLLATACAPKRVVWSDPSLPDPKEEVEVLAPTAVLQEGARSEDPGDRARALSTLIRLAPTVSEGGWDQRALWDPDGWVQLQGVIAVADRLDEPQSVQVLEAFVRRTDGLVDDYARGAAGTRLARAGHTGTKDALHAAWSSTKNPWHAAPVQLAAAAMGDAEALAPLKKSLADADVPMEPTFLLDVGRSGLDLASSLEAGNEWVEPEMRLAFATARLQLGDKGGAAVLRSALEGDDELAALEALDYVSRLDGEHGERLLKRARTGGSELARVYADLALISRGVGSSKQLDTAIHHDDREIRELAVRFATELADGDDAERRAVKQARRILRTGINDEDLAVRLRALRGVATLGLGMGSSTIEKHLADEMLSVRIEAAGALLASSR